VYVGGGFQSAGGVPVKNVARWEGSNWFPMAEGLGQFVTALTVNGTNLYAGGSFTIAGGSVANRLARWDGNAWNAVGGNIASGAINVITVVGNDLYIGGAFSITGIAGSMRIARWNGSSWSALGTGVGNAASSVRAIVVRGSQLYVGGYFTTAGGNSAWHVARWDGSNWFPLGSGTGIFSTSGVEGLGIIDNEVYATGDFTTAGEIPSLYFGIWHIPPFVASLVALDSGAFVLHWPSESNRIYRVHSTTDLSQPFTPLSGLIPSGGTNTTYTNAVGAPAEFFQIEQLPP
jgi:hypothetical protein